MLNKSILITMKSDTIGQDTIGQDTMNEKQVTNTNRGKKSACPAVVECEICCVCFMLLFVLGLLVSFVAAFIVWIIALVNGKDLVITEKCPDNELWEWLLVFGIVIFLFAGGNTKSKENKDGEHCLLCSCKLFCNLVLIACSIALSWWGNEQLKKDNNCMQRNYGDSVFYETVVAFWWFHFVTLCIILGILGILIMGVVVYLVLMNCKCGRVLIDKMSNKKNNGNDDLIIDIMSDEHDKNDSMGQSSNMFDL
jgi:hypothetical protein